jgi:Xaa-Pro aminopeptidase
MTVTNPATPPAFTNDDFAARMRQVVSSAEQKGLAGVIVTPGPDLVWLTGYRPTASTERLTMLVLSPDNEPTLLVPIFE